MQLVKALRASSDSRIAFVGAGGKTTAVFRLARQLPPPVVVTSSTHLAVSQLKLADQVFVVGDPFEVQRLQSRDFEGVVLFAGKKTEDGRTEGVNPRTIGAIRDLVDSKGIPLLIEADGSRMRPVKAPAAHEPPIPGFVNTVVVVAGLSGLQKPLSHDWVHRPERFSELSGVPLGAVLTPDAYIAVLMHEEGGLKNIPADARRVVLLNQADSEERWTQANEMVKPLLRAYEAVVIASHHSETETHERTEGEVLTAHEPIAGVVLAAGGSSRMGRVKQLLNWQEKPFVRHVAEKALQASLDPVVVVTGAEGEAVNRVLEDLPVQVAHNPNWEVGQSTSVKIGLSHLPPRIGGAIFFLADQPQVPLTLTRNLVETHAGTLAPIVAPKVKGQRGNPVLFDRITFASFDDLVGDVGARPLFSRFQAAWVEWDDPNPLVDVDTPEDYEKLLDQMGSEYLNS